MTYFYPTFYPKPSILSMINNKYTFKISFGNIQRKFLKYYMFQQTEFEFSVITFIAPKNSNFEFANIYIF